MNKISFIIKYDKNAEPERKYILCIMKNDKCVEAPRFAQLCEALDIVANYIEEFPLNKNFNIEVQL